MSPLGVRSIVGFIAYRTDKVNRLQDTSTLRRLDTCRRSRCRLKNAYRMSYTSLVLVVVYSFVVIDVVFDVLTCHDVHVKWRPFAVVGVERVELKPFHRFLFRPTLLVLQLFDHLLAVVHNAVITRPCSSDRLWRRQSRRRIAFCLCSSVPFLVVKEAEAN